MRNYHKKWWKELYRFQFYFNAKEFEKIVVKIMKNPYSKIEYEEVIFKAGDTFLTVFNDKKKAKFYYELYLKEFGENGIFSKQISERISKL